jgi:hypothetical protein
VVVGFSVSL